MAEEVSIPLPIGVSSAILMGVAALLCWVLTAATGFAFCLANDCRRAFSASAAASCFFRLSLLL